MNKNTKVVWHRVPREEWDDTPKYTAHIDGVDFTITRGVFMTYYFQWHVSAEVNGKVVTLKHHFHGANRGITSHKDAKAWAAANAAEIRQLAEEAPR